MNKSVTITKISIKNAFGLEDVEITPGNVTLVSGRNGKGKTSVLNAINSALSGGNNPALLHKGKKQGEVVLALSDDVVIKRRFTEKTNTLTVIKDGVKLKSPQAFINQEYLSSIGCNPLKLLTASKSERTTIFLDTLPVDIDIHTVSQIADEKVSASPGEHGIVVIDRVRKKLYDKRHQLGRQVRSIKNTIDKLSENHDPNNAKIHKELNEEISKLEGKQKSLIRTEAEGMAELTAAHEKETLMLQNQKANLEGELIRVEASHAEKIESHNQRHNDDMAQLNSSLSSNLTALDLEYQKKIQQLQQEHSTKADELKSKHREEKDSLCEASQEALSELSNDFIERKETSQTKISQIVSKLQVMQAEHNASKDKLRANFTDQKSEISLEIMSKKSKLEVLNDRLVTEKIIDQNKSELKSIQKEHENSDSAIHELDKYKRNLLESFELEGFDYQEGQVLIDGIPFDAVNTAKLMDVAVSLARLQSPTLRLMCIDGIEALDEESFDQLIEKAEKYQMNMIVTKVSNSNELMIEAA